MVTGPGSAVGVLTVSPTVAALIPAAGQGLRLRAGPGDAQPAKALRTVGGVTLVQRAVDLLSGVADEIVVAAPAGAVDALRAELADRRGDVAVVAGADTRQGSVAHALDAVSGSITSILVHDAARALVPVDVVLRVLAALEAGAACVVPVIAAADSLRGVAPDGSNAPLDRSLVRLVQTPQGFAAAALRRAHARAAGDDATDDATLVEATGETVTLVDGDPLGFKITRPLDLVLAEALLRNGA